MKYDLPDIDIDLQNRDEALNGLDHTKASLNREGALVPHTTGVYFQDIPCDPFLDVASIDSSTAESRGYFKIDLLNVSLYDGVRDEKHLDELMERTPRWDLLAYKEFVEELWHLHNHYELVKLMAPTNVDELAMLLGIIRPAKAHLQGKAWRHVEQSVWDKPKPGDKGYNYRKSFFKKSHAYAYALGIVVQMNLIVEQLYNV